MRLELAGWGSIGTAVFLPPDPEKENVVS